MECHSRVLLPLLPPENLGVPGRWFLGGGVPSDISLHLPYGYVILLMDKILHHLGCMKPCK